MATKSRNSSSRPNRASRTSRLAARYVARILSPLIRVRPDDRLLQDLSPRVIRSVLTSLRKWPRVFDRSVVCVKPSIGTFGTGRKHPNGDIVGELRWTVCVCSLFAEQIDLFCKASRRFSQALSEARYADADAELDLIASCHGISMWLLEARLLLAQLSKGTTGQQDEFDRLRVQLKDGVSPLLLFLATRRIEFESTPLSYEAAVADFLASLAADPLQARFKRYVAFRTIPFSPASNETLADVLWQESRFSAIDLYLALIDVLRYMLDVQPIEIPLDIRREVVSLAETIADPSLQTIASMLIPGRNLRSDTHIEMVVAAADAYAAGQYNEVIALSDVILARQPDCFDAVELWAKSMINSEQLHSFKPPPVEQLGIIDSMRASVLLALAPEYSARQESVQVLKKLAYTLLSLPQGKQMIALCASLTADVSRHRSSVMIAVHASALTPRSSNALYEDSAACELLDSLARRSGAGVSVALFSAFRSTGSGKADIPEQVAIEQQLMYRARAIERGGRHEEALAIYDELERIAKPCSTFADDALCGRFDCLISMKQFAACAQLVAEATLADRPLPRSAQLNRLAEAYERYADEQARADVTWSIFFAIRGVIEPTARNAHSVFAAMDTFLQAQGVDRPSLLPSSAITRSELRALFLKLTGSPEVLEYSIAFSSIDELEAERIAICQQLLVLDPDNAEDYSAEIDRLVRRITVRSDLKSMNLGKVHVDLEGIRRTLDPALSVRIDYFVAIATGEVARLDRPALRPSAENDGEQTSVQLEAVGTIGPVFFKPIFDAIHRRYVSSNEFGLDSYLSLRIRHGVLVGHIRSVFEQARLITRRNVDGAYQPNMAWDACLGQFGIPTKAVQDSLAEFAARVDGLLEEVKSQRIQVRSETHPNGLFDLSFTEDELTDLYRKSIICRTAQELVDLLFTAMNERTVRALPAVRSYVTTELDRLLSDALSDLHAKLHSAHNSFRVTELSAAIPECRTRVHAELATVAEWFVFRTDLEHTDFELSQPVRAVEEVVRKVNPSSALDVRTDIDVPVFIRGECFAHFVDVLWLLLDNVAKHASGVSKIAEITGRVDGDFLVLAVRNRIDADSSVLSPDKLEALQIRLRPGESPLAVRREGGSGFFKLKKIVEHGLGLGDSFQCAIACEASPDGTPPAFVVTLRVALSRVCVCKS